MSQQHYLFVNGDHLKKPHIIKTYSFTTDEEETALIENPSTESNHQKFVSLYNPSIDTNNNEDYSSENTPKIRKRKSRRQTEIEVFDQFNKTHFCLSVFFSQVVKKQEEEVLEIPPWYIRWNVLRLFSILSLLLLLYLFWIKREIWLESRVRRPMVTKSENNLEQTFDRPNEDLIENSEEKDNITVDIPINRSNSSPAKQSNKSKEKSFLYPLQNSTIRYSTHKDLLETIRTNLKSRIYERKFVVKLSKLTGLTRVQLNRFIYKKDFRLITFERFLTFLDLFDLMILIVPKKDFS